MFDLSRLAAANLVAQIDFHESLGSTSDRALALAAEGATELPLLVLALRQTTGRGRGANRWWSADGALTFSLVLEAPPQRLPSDRWPQVALVAGLAVCEALQSLAPAANVQVKWPNDVYLGGRKVGGILSESVPGWRDRLVVGIGVNVNNRVQGTGDRRLETRGGGPEPEQWRRAATSLVEQDGLARDMTAVLVAILDQFDRRWQELLGSRFAPLAADFRQRCFLTGKAVTIEQPGGQALAGRCRGIDDEGVLRVQDLAGEHRVRSGAVVAWE
jgi:BirA family transcriptional regulator, biotin operon repressor / biotin---[acetyl-CoA-carboxylase] ligase